MRKETKNGVTYTFETDDLTSEAVDVDVQPGIEYLILEYGLNMPDSKKSFPEVKYLTIQKGVKRIEIPNTLFPNVKCVVSKDIRTFESGRYLVSNIGGKTLKNVRTNLPCEAGAYLLIHSGERKLGMNERIEEVAERLKKEAKGVPFLTVFTFGEYGTEDHGENTCGRLMLSFTGFGKNK